MLAPDLSSTSFVSRHVNVCVRSTWCSGVPSLPWQPPCTTATAPSGAPCLRHICSWLHGQRETGPAFCADAQAVLLDACTLSHTAHSTSLALQLWNASAWAFSTNRMQPSRTVCHASAPVHTQLTQPLPCRYVTAFIVINVLRIFGHGGKSSGPLFTLPALAISGAPMLSHPPADQSQLLSGLVLDTVA